MESHKESGTSQSVNTLLVVLLIIASFLIGSLWTNVQYLKKATVVAENNNNNVVTNPSPTADTQPQPTAPAVQASVPKVDLKTDHIRGEKNAKLALIEYSDLECPYCKKFHPTAQQVVDTYKGKVMWVFRHFPLSFHANAQKEAEASECANELGGDEAFWKYVDAIIERTSATGTGFALDKLVPLAKELGLDDAKFKKCLDDGKYTKFVGDQQTAGQNGGISGTPGNILMNLSTGETKLLPGAVPFTQIQPVIDEMLK